MLPLSYFLLERNITFKSMRVFGCCVWVCLPRMWKKRFNDAVCKDIFWDTFHTLIVSSYIIAMSLNM